MFCSSKQRIGVVPLSVETTSQVTVEDAKSSESQNSNRNLIVETMEFSPINTNVENAINKETISLSDGYDNNSIERESSQGIIHTNLIL